MQLLSLTRCRGNIILDLDETSATGLLLDLLNKGHNAKISKDREFYLGTCEDDGSGGSQLVRQKFRSNMKNMAYIDIFGYYLDLSSSSHKRRPIQRKHVHRYHYRLPSWAESAGQIHFTVMLSDGPNAVL